MFETIANPYTTVLGPVESGATRINMAQTINGAGWMLGPTVGGFFVNSGGEGANANAGLQFPYLGIAVFVSVLLVVFIFSNVPNLRAQDESQKSGKQITRLTPSPGQYLGIGFVLLIVCGLMYVFIIPILALLWICLN